MSRHLDELFRFLERQHAEVISEALHNILDFPGETDHRINKIYLSLPGLCCKILGGDPGLAAGITSAWEVLYLAAHLLDTVADEGESVTDRGQLVTLSASCIPIARMLLLEQTQHGLSAEKCNDILRDFDQAILRVCAGQVKDLTEKEPSLEKCWEIAGEKTGEIFALAARSGARLCSDNPEVIALLSDLGQHLGILVQIGDDVSGLWPQDNNRSDLACGKWTLPVSYAMQVLSAPERKKLKGYLDLANEDRQREVTARQVLIEAGALLYLAAEADGHRRRALNALAEAVPSTANHQEIMDLVEQATAWTYSYDGEVS